MEQFKRKNIVFYTIITLVSLICVIANFFLKDKIISVCIINSFVIILLCIMLGHYYLKPKVESISTNQPNNTVNKSKKEKVIFYTVFWTAILIAILLRTLNYLNYPAGINQDEASMVYDAWSILNHEIDRNGHSYPIYAEAWGNGQNVLLTYLTIPFVKIFGMNLFSARIVMLLVSISSIFGFYLLMKEITNNKQIALISMIIYIICPWQIMLSRWGLESNLFPLVAIWAIYFLIKSTKQNNHWYLLPSCVIFGISLYSYAISYIFVPLFLIVCYIIMFKKKLLHLNSFIVSNVILLIFALPLMLFLAVNYGIIGEFSIGKISIYKMNSIRTSEIGFSFKNIINLFRLLFLGQDGLQYNYPFNIGFLYIIALPLSIFGIFSSCSKIFKEKKINYILAFVWLTISLFISLFIQDVNVNKINILMPAILIFESFGIYELIKYSKISFLALSSILLCLIVMFSTVYFNNYGKNDKITFNAGLTESISYANCIKGNKNVLIDETIHDSYIYYLYTIKYDTIEYLNSRVVNENNVVISIGELNFCWNLENLDTNTIYIVKKKNYHKLGTHNMNVKEFENFYVLYN